MTKKISPAKIRKTIEFADLKRLSFCNRHKLPQVVEVLGRRMRWMGIGWIDEGPAKGDEILVVETAESKSLKSRAKPHRMKGAVK